MDAQREKTVDAEAERLYRQAAEQMAQWVSVPLAGFWQQLRDASLAAAAEADDYSRQQADLQCLQLLLLQQADWHLRFATALESRALVWRSHRQPVAEGKMLTLMSEIELSVQLQVQGLVAELGKTHEVLLRETARQVARLAHTLGLRDDAGNPWSVEAIVGAFAQTLPLADLNPALVPRVFAHLGKVLAPVLQEALPRLAHLLQSGRMQAVAATWPPVSAPVADGPAPAMQTQAATAPPTFSADSLQTQTQASAQGTGLPRYRDVVREHLQNWRQKSGSTDAAMPAARVLQTSELLTVASMLQGEDPAPFVAALAGGEDAAPLRQVIREEMLKAAAQLGFAQDGADFARDEADAIDLVAMLFGHLARRNELPPMGTQMFAKLVLPYVKVAVLDDSLFNRRVHPARRFLDTLAETCEGADAAHAQDRELLGRADRVVDTVVTRFQQDQAIFALATEELRELLQQQQQRMKLASQRLAESLHGRERRQFARDAAHQALLERVQGRQLSDGVFEFMRRHWHDALLQTWLRHGSDSPRYRELLALGDALPRFDADGAALRSDRLAQGFAEQLACLRQCVTQTGLVGEAAEEAIARLLHALADAEGERRPHDGEVPAPEAELPLADATAGNSQRPADPQLVQRLAKLSEGQNFRLCEADGRETLARLVWVSPLTSRFLILNRCGSRRLVLSPEELAQRVEAGEISLCPSEAPVDQAMRDLWEGLRAS